MNNALNTCVILLAIVFVITACESNEEVVEEVPTETEVEEEVTKEEVTEEEATEEPAVADISAEALWENITTSDYSANWKHWPGLDPMYEGTHPHGAMLSTYLNDTAYNALKDGISEMPYGSVIVKENYMPDKTLAAITVMQRVEGYNPEAGDWFWAKYLPDGKLDTMGKDGKEMPIAGKAPGCIDCHTASAAGIDYIMTTKK